MYKVETDELEHMVSTFINHYEEIFNVSYGAKPDIVIADSDVYKDYLEFYNTVLEIEANENVIATQAVHIYENTGGLYDDLTHSILISKNVLDETDNRDSGWLDFVIAHEVAHGYQLNQGARTAASIMKEAITQYGINDFKQDINTKMKVECDIFAEMAQSEGMAEYMTHTMLSASKDKGFRELNAFNYAEERHTQYKTVKDTFPGILSKIECIQAQAQEGLLDKIQIHLYLPMLKKCQYLAGYGYVEHNIEMGSDINELIASPPHNISDMLKEF